MKKLTKLILFGAFLLSPPVVMSQDQTCHDTLAVSGGYNLMSLPNLFSRLHNYFETIKKNDFQRATNFTIERNKVKAAGAFARRYSSSESLARVTSVDKICVRNIKIFDTNYYAVVNGVIKYEPSSNKPDEMIFLYVTESLGEFYFTELMFDKFDIYEVIIEEKIGKFTN